MLDLLSQRKRRAEKVTWYLQIVPFIRFMGLNGSLAYGICDNTSDIDFFMITKHNRIWTARFFVVVMLKLINVYRSGDTPIEKAGKICPNCYVTDKYLLINPQNRFVAQDYSQMIPLFDSGGVYRKFLKKNEWMKKYGYFPPKRALVLFQSGGIFFALRRIAEFVLGGRIGEWLEDKLKNYQMERIMKDPRTNREGSGVYVDDNELRFHPKPKM